MKQPHNSNPLYEGNTPRKRLNTPRQNTQLQFYASNVFWQSLRRVEDVAWPKITADSCTVDDMTLDYINADKNIAYYNYMPLYYIKTNEITPCTLPLWIKKLCVWYRSEATDSIWLEDAWSWVTNVPNACA